MIERKIVSNDKSVKSKITKFQVYEDGGALYLRLVYEVENDVSIREVELPKVELGVLTHFVPDIDYSVSEGTNPWEIDQSCHIYAGARRFAVLCGDTDVAKNIFFTEKTLKEKPTEMTLEEIEKKLGYKVKIVSEK